VGEAVEEGPGEPFRAEDLGPLVEGQVGGSQDRAAWMRPPGSSQWRIWQSAPMRLRDILRRQPPVLGSATPKAGTGGGDGEADVGVD
jgi:hypothetical protein